MIAPVLLAIFAPVRYVPFLNARYGFGLDRPTFLTPQRPPDNGDGREFREGAIVLRAYGSMNVEGATSARRLRKLRAEAKGGSISLALAKADWCAASYTKAGTVYYAKSFVGKGTIRTVEFEYPASEAKRMAPIVKHVVRSFHPTPTTFR